MPGPGTANGFVLLSFPPIEYLKSPTLYFSYAYVPGPGTLSRPTDAIELPNRAPIVFPGDSRILEGTLYLSGLALTFLSLSIILAPIVHFGSLLLSTRDDWYAPGAASDSSLFFFWNWSIMTKKGKCKAKEREKPQR